MFLQIQQSANQRLHDFEGHACTGHWTSWHGHLFAETPILCLAGGIKTRWDFFSIVMIGDWSRTNLRWTQSVARVCTCYAATIWLTVQNLFPSLDPALVPLKSRRLCPEGNWYMIVRTELTSIICCLQNLTTGTCLGQIWLWSTNSSAHRICFGHCLT